MGSWPDPSIDPFDTGDSAPAVEIRHSAGRAPIAPWVPSLADLARVATDFAPAAGNDAPERILGPWALELDAHVPADRDLLLVAVAAACFVAPDDERMPFVQWSRGTTQPTSDERAAFRAVGRTPWSLWRATGDGVEDLVGLAPAFLPDRPVLRVEAPVGFTVAARIVRTSRQEVMVTPIAVPGTPLRSTIARWVAEEYARTRPTSLEDMLAASGHVLARRLCEWFWVTRRA